MSSHRAAAADEAPYVETPSLNDVLFGRGSGPNDHEGNVLFRNLVKERKSEYMSTNHRQTKANIAAEIVNAIRAKSGRFLKKADAKDCRQLGIDEDADVWCRVDEKTIMEKAKQALRQKGGDSDVSRPDDNAAVAADHVLSDGSINDRPPFYEGPAEPLAGFAPERPMDPSPAVHPEIYRSGDLPPQVNQAPQYWRTYGENPENMGDMYASHPMQTVQGFLPEGIPPPHQGYAQVNPQNYMAELPCERLSEENMHRLVAAGYGYEEVGDGPEDDDRRRSLQVDDLMVSFHRMGTDEMATSSSDNVRSHESTETMGTIEPLPLGASNVCMMSSSTFSILKGALDGLSSPRGSISRPGKYKRDMSAGSSNQGTSSEGKARGGSASSGEGNARRDSASSDMSLSFSHVDTAWGHHSSSSHPGNQFSLVLEGDELEVSNQELGGDASNQKIAAEPCPVHLMEDDPDSLARFGSTSISILQAALGDSNDTMGKVSQLDGDASNQKIAVEPRPVHLMEEDPDSLSRFGSTSLSILRATLGDSVDTMGASGKLSQRNTKGDSN